MRKLFSFIYHRLPENWKRIIRLHSYAYNDIKGGGKTLFKSRIDRELKVFLKVEEQADKHLVREVKKDIKHCWLKYGSSPEEYFLFGFRNLDNAGRSAFVTDYEKDMTLKAKMGLDIFAKELRDKFNFYSLTAPYFHRKAFKVTESTPETEFIAFAVATKGLFVKPDNQSRGRGAHKSIVNSVDDAKKEYFELRSRGGEWMVEELICQSEATKQWNPSSVNTVRVPTFLNSEGFFVCSPVFRTGRAGFCVDNAGSGGIIAVVDANTGVLYTDGISEEGRFYEKHPDSGLSFKGWQIPRWNELMSIVEDVHKKCMPHHLYIGWDFALTDDGWVLIEGNWGQFLSQYSDHVGLKDRFMHYMNAGFYKEMR